MNASRPWYSNPTQPPRHRSSRRRVDRLTACTRSRDRSRSSPASRRRTRRAAPRSSRARCPAPSRLMAAGAGARGCRRVSGSISSRPMSAMATLAREAVGPQPLTDRHRPAPASCSRRRRGCRHADDGPRGSARRRAHLPDRAAARQDQRRRGGEIRAAAPRGTRRPGLAGPLGHRRRASQCAEQALESLDLGVGRAAADPTGSRRSWCGVPFQPRAQLFHPAMQVHAHRGGGQSRPLRDLRPVRPSTRRSTSVSR